MHNTALASIFKLSTLLRADVCTRVQFNCSTAGLSRSSHSLKTGQNGTSVREKFQPKLSSPNKISQKLIAERVAITAGVRFSLHRNTQNLTTCHMIIPEKKTAEEAMENPKPANEEAEEKTSTNDASPKEDSKDDDDGASASSGENVPADTTIAATSLPTAWVQQQKEKRRAERTPAPSSTKDQRAIFTPEPVSVVHMPRQ